MDNNSFDEKIHGQAGSEDALGEGTHGERDCLTAESDLRDYDSFEGIFAWICVLIGYLFCRAFPISDYPFGMLLTVIIALGANFGFLAKKCVRFGRDSVVSAVACLAFSATFLWNSKPFAIALAFVMALVSYCFFVYSATSNRVEGGKSDVLPLDLLRALKGFSFYAVADMFRLMFLRKNKGFKTAFKIIAGLIVAIVPTALVISLLSYDGGFSKLLSDAFSFLDDFEPMSHVISLLIGLIFASYVFGVYAVNTASREKCDAVEYTERVRKLQAVPVLTVASALLPLAVVYIFFFVSQWQYYVSGFSGELPEGVINYAEYARSGFFELCTVSGINFALLSAVALLMRRENAIGKTFLRIASVVLSLMTLVLIGTAMAKMSLYIDRYGLTEKRVLSSWLMVLLAVIFLLIIVRQFVPRFKLLTASAVCVVLMSFLLTASDYCRIIADYNVDAYLDGDIETIDEFALLKLGDDSAEAAVRLCRYWEERGIEINRLKTLKNSLRERYTDLGYHEGIFAFSLDRMRAKSAIEGVYSSGELKERGTLCFDPGYQEFSPIFTTLSVQQTEQLRAVVKDIRFVKEYSGCGFNSDIYFIVDGNTYFVSLDECCTLSVFGGLCGHPDDEQKKVICSIFEQCGGFFPCY
jgi:hypothetical protein